jgi:hydroxypyruvate reductase
LIILTLYITMGSLISAREFLIRSWTAGVESVVGERVVREAIAADGLTEISHVLAIGKAASSMCLGLLPKLSRSGTGLLITKYKHVDINAFQSVNIEIIESGHPVPDENSLLAGRRALAFVQSIPATENLVLLVSGGASALVECLPHNINRDTLKWINEKLLAYGYSIDQINFVRSGLSEIKGGKLLDHFSGSEVQVYAISDVPGDSIDLIGSGIGSQGKTGIPAFEVPDEIQQLLDSIESGTMTRGGETAYRYGARVVATNDIARNAVQNYVTKEGYHVVENGFSLNNDVGKVAKDIAGQLLHGPRGVYIWGGEPTIVLPDSPGVGGRNQSLALAIAREIDGCNDISVIVGGTDGSDGPTDAAGGVVDGTTCSLTPGGDPALRKADAGTFLKKAGSLLVSGPTGTNVMDLVVGLKN